MIKKLLALTFVVAAAVVYVQLDLGAQLTFENLKAQQVRLEEHRLAAPYATLATYVALYVLVTALSLPGAAILGIGGGMVFGLLPGTLAVSVASTVGATLAFLVARHMLRGSLEARFHTRLEAVNEGIRREGAFYLFSMRLIPLFPFFVINLVFGLTRMRTWTFAWVSQVGMLAGTVVFVNAGTQLAALESPGDIFSPSLLAAFALLGVFPLIARRVLAWLAARKVMAGYRAPKQFDYNVVVIGAGSGGLVSAYIAAAVRAKVALIEKGEMGGDCLNTGCVPSKALLRSARALHDARRAADWGFKKAEVEFDFADVMERVQDVIKEIAPHDSVERYTDLGVECLRGEAQVIDPYRVQVGVRELTTRNIVVATGARPLVPELPGLDDARPLTSDTLWGLRKLPRRLVVIGGGPIGCELAQAFARFGSEVTQVEDGTRLLAREDAEVSELLCARFEQEGVAVRTRHRVVELGVRGPEKLVICETPGGRVELVCDEILMALGRRANVTGFGLQELGVELTSTGTLAVDEFQRTNFPNIFAVGDVAGPLQFTHYASHQAWYAAVNALFSPLRNFRRDDRVIPWTTFTDPEVARVGLSEEQAIERGVPHRVVRYDLAELDRAIADGAAYGLVKVITPPKGDRVLGALVVGSRAGDVLVEFVAAMRHGFGLNKILGTVHTYPTMAEANKFAAGEWKRQTRPRRALEWLERFHRWRRG